MAHKKTPSQQIISLPNISNKQTRREKIRRFTLDKNLVSAIQYISTLILLGCVIYWREATPAFYTFLGVTTAYIFGRRLVG